MTQRVAAIRQITIWLLAAFALTWNSQSQADANRVALERGVLGVNWGASLSDVLKSYPEGRPILENTRVGVRQPSGLLGVRSFKDSFQLHIDPSRGFERMTFLPLATDVERLKSLLHSAFGPPRCISMKSLSAYTHVCEWNTQGFGAMLKYITTGASPTLIPIDMPFVSMQPKRLSASFIDEYEAARNKTQ